MLFTLLVLCLIHSQTNITSIAEDIYFYYALGVAIAIERSLCQQQKLPTMDIYSKT